MQNRCTKCTGYKRVMGMGCLWHDCDQCKGTGYEPIADVIPGYKYIPDAVLEVQEENTHFKVFQSLDDGLGSAFKLDLPARGALTINKESITPVKELPKKRGRRPRIVLEKASNE